MQLCSGDDFALSFGKLLTVRAGITPAVPYLTALALLQRRDVEDGVAAGQIALCVFLEPFAKRPSGDASAIDQVAAFVFGCPQIDARESGKHRQSVGCLVVGPGIGSRPGEI